jgi:hypothetical protein
MGFIADFVAAGLLLARTDPVDEWLQVALALSIENFLQDIRSWRSPGLLRSKASPTASSGEWSTPPPACVIPKLVDAANHRHPSVAAEDVHSRQTRQVTP